MNPLKAQLHILQLEGYEPIRFLKWWFSHPFTFQTGGKKPLVHTPKTKLILAVTFLLYLTVVLFLPFPINLVFVAILALEPFPLLLLSLVIIKPYEIARRRLTIALVHQTITGHPHLTVIGITGSYGKTSTKDFLFEILRRDQQTLKTPESYNTVFGIAKVVKLELHKKLHYFICEFGAYIRGEIKELTHMIPPNYAILTAIGSQHLERFKSLTNTTLAKFELIDAIKPERALVNLDNKYIKDHLRLPQYAGAKTYSFTDSTANFYVSSSKLKPDGAEFAVTYQNKKYPFATKLFGSANLENLVAAVSMSFILEIDPKTIQGAIENIIPSPHRLEIVKVGDATLIDNAYSSNEMGFTKVISDLKSLPGKKALITPGIIELGNQAGAIHERIGVLAAEVFDHIVLVGRSERTENFARGIAGKVKVDYLENNSSVWPTIDALSRKYDWILLE
ncbi:MAG: UDP-N-acetylmuramoyl-tripeptide--D-alanyl-D-alanine ligase, partial [Patescibacteria group bacterium]